MKCVMDLPFVHQIESNRITMIPLYPFFPPRRIIKKYQIYHETNQNVISKTFPYLFQIIAKYIYKKIEDETRTRSEF